MHTRFLVRVLPLAVLVTVIGLVPRANADWLEGGSLTFNIDGNAFADGADAAYLASFGVNLDPTQTFMEFGKHFTPAETIGVGVLGFRPESNPPIVDFNDLRDGWVRPSSDNLLYGINGRGPIPNPQPPGRNAQATTLEFDAADVEGTAVGSIGTIGSTSFWYSNQAMIDTGSIWIGFGDLTLQYDAGRAVGGNSGWYFTNELLFSQILFDTKNVSVLATAATGGGPGSLSISGDLVVSQEFRDAFALTAGLDVGSFQLVGVTAVPEPSTLALLGFGALGLFMVRRRPVIGS